jgi:hypothetical protein
MTEAEAKKPVIEVDDYYDKVHQTSWARRTAGFMAGTTLGAAYGLVIGAVAALFPMILGALGVAGATAVGAPALAAVATSAVLMAGIGGLMGFAANALVGADAGAVSAGFAEKEKREKLDQMKEVGAVGASTQADVKLKANEDTNTPPPFKWRAGAITIPAATAFGAAMGMNPITAPSFISASGLGTLGLAAGSTAAVAASAGILGLFGVVLAMPNAYYTNKVSNFYYKALQGKFFGGDKLQEANAAPVLEPSGNDIVAVTDLQISNEQAPAKRFSTQKTSYSFQGMVEKTEEHSNEHPLINR